jgi:uncharacterized protein YndB with AHSA1/START domain
MTQKTEPKGSVFVFACPLRGIDDVRKRPDKIPAPPNISTTRELEEIHMASIIKDFIIDAAPADVWAALEDFGALHTRLVPGFVTACTFDGEARTVTFSNGSVAKETLVTSDAERHRLVYAIASDKLKQHSASAQVFDDGKGGTRFVWITDVLPNEVAPYMSGQMDLGVTAMQKALARKAA